MFFATVVLIKIAEAERNKLKLRYLRNFARRSKFHAWH
jgi:hypothetical protein